MCAAHKNFVRCKQKGEAAMLSKTAIALGIALTLGAVSSASAAWDPWVQPSGALGYASGSQSRGFEAFAQAPSAGRVERNGYVVSPPAVYQDGTIIGHDPDPNVRQQLQNDYPFVEY
jgi:hypothetical protein